MPIKRKRIFLSFFQIAASGLPFFHTTEVSFRDEGRKEAISFKQKSLGLIAKPKKVIK
jgi:hypothetical protein